MPRGHSAGIRRGLCLQQTSYFVRIYEKSYIDIFLEKGLDNRIKFSRFFDNFAFWGDYSYKVSHKMRTYIKSCRLPSSVNPVPRMCSSECSMYCDTHYQPCRKGGRQDFSGCTPLLLSKHADDAQATSFGERGRGEEGKRGRRPRRKEERERKRETPHPF